MWAFKTLIGLRICAALWLNITDTQHDRHWPEDSVLAAPWEAVHREAVPREAVGPAAAEPLPPVARVAPVTSAGATEGAWYFCGN